ncbi:MAG TPA: cyanophycinase [Candidatus Acidoferrales bacterium]|nr:cyanophycinase [Candidatus Acidoferrales bacterium]
MDWEPRVGAIHHAASLKSSQPDRRNPLAGPLIAVLCLAAVFLAAPVISAAPVGRQTVGPARGWLVIVGGGTLVPEITERFVQLAGGPDASFVVFPTASADPIDLAKVKQQFLKTFGVKNVVVLHTRDPQVANSRDFVAPLLHANAVWFYGGRQWRLDDAYLNTLTEREVKAVLARGGVVGGSSAGATIQGSFLVRGSVKGNTIMVAARPSHRVGFGLLSNSAIDQHLLVRHRQNDLIPVITAHSSLLGIGLDQSTAIVVHGSEFQVIGVSKVAIYDNRMHDGKKYYFVSHGQGFNLGARKSE